MTIRAGPQRAEHSVLLDYISPVNIIVFFKALRSRHWIAGLGVAASLVLRLFIVLSSGLFVLQQVERTEYLELSIFDTFPVDVYTSKIVVASAEEGPPNVRSWETVLSFTNYNLTPPRGTTRETAFQTFTTPSELGVNVILTSANVNVFSSTLDCESVNLGPSPMTSKTESALREVNKGCNQNMGT